jgi:hypothetical protein
VDSGAVVSIDLTGIVSADGLVTFVIPGTAEASIALASRESGAPPLLLITVLDPPAG